MRPYRVRRPTHHTTVGRSVPTVVGECQPSRGRRLCAGATWTSREGGFRVGTTWIFTWLAALAWVPPGFHGKPTVLAWVPAGLAGDRGGPGLSCPGAICCPPADHCIFLDSQTSRAIHPPSPQALLWCAAQGTGCRCRAAALDHCGQGERKAAENPRECVCGGGGGGGVLWVLAGLWSRR